MLSVAKYVDANKQLHSAIIPDHGLFHRSKNESMLQLAHPSIQQSEFY